MAEAGIFVSRVGASVPTAADYQFVYNSRWPSLACAFDKLVTIPAAPVFNFSTVSFAHNLNMYPLTLAWIIESGVCKGRIFNSNYQVPQLPQSLVSFSFDKNNVYLANYDSTKSYQICVKCYNLDITKAADYTLPAFPAVNQPYDPTVGIKVTKYGKDLNSTELRDFILHSRAQSPAVLAVVPGMSKAGGFDGIYYNNPVGYVPWTLAFVGGSNFMIDPSVYSPLAPGFDGVQAQVFTLGSGLTFHESAIKTIPVNGAILSSFGASIIPLSLVVLRDPLVVANSLQVQY